MNHDTITYTLNFIYPAAIAAMWFYFKRNSDICNRDRRQLWRAMSRLSGIVRAVKGCSQTGCVLREQADEVLEASEEDVDTNETRRKTLDQLGMRESPTPMIRYHVPDPQS